jgi:hypothetical protein
MAEHPHLQGLWSDVPEILCYDDWPDVVFWQSKFDAHPVFQSLPHALRLFPEVKIGQRRKRNLAKLKREAGQPTLRRYESSIIEDHAIPMRERNLHDYFNSLVWLRFPLAKYALHERAYRSYFEAPPAVTGNLRNDLTDALTRFDEGGLAYFPDAGEDAGAVRALFRSLDATAKSEYAARRASQFEVFGHGLMEVWNQGGRNLTASALVVEVQVGENRDEALARVLKEMAEPQGRFGTFLLDEVLVSQGANSGSIRPNL